jgi:hypothetical protein
MPQLPFVCMHCHTVFQRVEVPRAVRLGETAAGFCPDCTRLMDDSLFSRHTTVVGKFSKRWCRCGREIVTGKAECEFCQVAEAAHV